MVLLCAQILFVLGSALVADLEEEEGVEAGRKGLRALK
jgi:hypothetical protein